MSDVKWQAVEDYIAGNLIEEDAALSEAQKASAAAGLPDIAVSATQGKLLQLLAQTLGARKDSRNRHAGWLQQHLARTRSGPRRAPHHVGSGPCTCGRGS